MKKNTNRYNNYKYDSDSDDDTSDSPSVKKMMPLTQPKGNKKKKTKKNKIWFDIF